MKTLWMTRGLPASGKSTWARAKQEELPLGEVKRVNKDDLRAMLDAGKWSPENEEFVVTLRDHVVISALALGKHVIVDDTNLAPVHEARLRQLARENNALFVLVDFTHVPLEECIQRDSVRSASVGEPVIRQMWEEFLRPGAAEPSSSSQTSDAG
jgi:predicted kinase